MSEDGGQFPCGHRRRRVYPRKEDCGAVDLFRDGGTACLRPLPTAVKVDGEDDFVFTKRRLEAHFAPKRNVCAERYRFRSRGQQSGEGVLQWVSVLRQLASTCEYGERTDEFLRDQIIERTSSTKLLQRLLMEGSDLTLTKSLTLAETLESAEREVKAMESPTAPVPFQAVHQ